jgi:hypothetical protein
MTTEHAAGLGSAGRFFGTLLFVLPAVGVGLAGAVALYAEPDEAIEWLLPWGALIAVLCTYVLLGRLWAGALTETFLTAAFAAYFLMLPVGYAVGAGFGACSTPMSGDCDLGPFYGGVGALAALGVVPIVLVVADSWQRWSNEAR